MSQLSNLDRLNPSLSSLPRRGERRRRPAAPANDEVITVVTFIDGIAGREDDLHAHLLSLAAPTRAEGGPPP